MATGDVWKKLRGTMKDLFGVGNEEIGFNIKNNFGVGEIRNAADDAYAILRASHITAGGYVQDIPTLLDLQARVPNIEFSFPGDTPPAAGTNTGKFGICHTDGASHNAGSVVYDSGVTLLPMPTVVVRTITIGAAVTGDLNLIANGLYALQGSTWTLKGDGSSQQLGGVKCVELVLGTNAQYTSTTSIPAGARVVRASIIVDTAYDATTEATVSVDGTTPVVVLGAADSRMTKVGQYDNDQTYDIESANEGLIVVDIANTPAAGTGSAFVWYATPVV